MRSVVLLVSMVFMFRTVKSVLARSGSKFRIVRSYRGSVNRMLNLFRDIRVVIMPLKLQCWTWKSARLTSMGWPVPVCMPRS